MTTIDLHPEELLDRARRGEASPEELRRLGEHLASCTACAFERAVAHDADLAAEPEADAVRRVTRSSVNALLGRPMGETQKPRIARRIAIAVAATACIATAAGAAIVIERG